MRGISNPLKFINGILFVDKFPNEAAWLGAKNQEGGSLYFRWVSTGRTINGTYNPIDGQAKLDNSVELGLVMGPMGLGSSNVENHHYAVCGALPPGIQIFVLLWNISSSPTAMRYYESTRLVV